jgi:hypothetical protein
VLACNHELGAGQDRLPPSEPVEGLLVAGSRRPGQPLGLLAQLLEIHHDLPPSTPDVRVSGPEKEDRSDKR